ncbi:uncharacterized protein CIMG_08484 [Coccidioides immitis RS]|uniref:Uncharacterized protein n=3 Tax=Coccidioides immitis TaxID=5501 RepID=A0A0E1S197_COCIM|nr:uncharacterized protein CIMG_08484 [Coccidioides immitis RS]EAS29738.2 hypothetical protein CIMG_08484 [Coccidioides immitis RS]
MGKTNAQFWASFLGPIFLKKREWHGALKRSKGKEKIGASGVFIFEKFNFVPESRSRQRVTGAVEPESLGRR